MLGLIPAVATAKPTLQDISRSFQNRLTQKPDSSNYTAILLGAAALIGILVLAAQWGRRREMPKSSNHPGRLVREVRRKIHLTRPQLKRLKILADRKGCSSPLTVLLCPSLLERKSPPADPPQKSSRPA